MIKVYFDLIPWWLAIALSLISLWFGYNMGKLHQEQRCSFEHEGKQ